MVSVGGFTARWARRPLTGPLCAGSGSGDVPRHAVSISARFGQKKAGEALALKHAQHLGQQQPDHVGVEPINFTTKPPAMPWMA